MQFWQAVSFIEPDQMIEVARRAEQVGFEGLLLPDHLFFPDTLESRYPYSEEGVPMFDGTVPFPDCWVTIAAMAQATTRLRFATGVHILPLRHPMDLAKAAGTAAIFSGDRAILGAGAGWMREEFDVMGVEWKTRGRRFDECIEVLRKLWTGEMVEHRGRFFDFPPIQMSPAPAKPVPIWIGGMSPAALRRAATLGDGWLGAGQTPEQIEDTAAELGRLRKEAGRGGEPFEIVAPLVKAPTRDVVKRLEECGVQGTVSFPFPYALGPRSSIEQKCEFLERYANDVIEGMNA